MNRSEQRAVLQNCQIVKLEAGGRKVSGGIAKAVLRVIDDHCWGNGYCNAGLKTIVRQSCFSRRTVIDALDLLEAAGYLSAEKPPGQRSTYRINWEGLTGAAGAPGGCSRCTTTSAAGAPLPVQQVHRGGAADAPTSAADAPASETEETKEKREGIPDSLNCEDFRNALTDWEAHRREIKKPLTELQRSKLIKKLDAIGADRAVAAIEHSIANGWQGIFEPEGRQQEGDPYRDKLLRTQRKLSARPRREVPA